MGVEMFRAGPVAGPAALDPAVAGARFKRFSSLCMASSVLAAPADRGPLPSDAALDSAESGSNAGGDASPNGSAADKENACPCPNPDDPPVGTPHGSPKLAGPGFGDGRSKGLVDGEDVCTSVAGADAENGSNTGVDAGAEPAPPPPEGAAGKAPKDCTAGCDCCPARRCCRCNAAALAALAALVALPALVTG